VLHVVEDDREFGVAAYFRKVARAERSGGRLLVPYARNVWLRETFPELLDEVREPFFTEGNLFVQQPLRDRVPAEWRPWRELFISAPGVRYPEIHADTHGTHAWLGQVWGQKRVYLWPPRHIELDERVRDTMFQRLVDADTDLERVFDHAPPVQLTLRAGQTAFVPAGWWHTTETRELSITVSGNFLTPDTLDDFFAFSRLDAEDPDSPHSEMNRRVTDDEAMIRAAYAGASAS
jgi:hypothetical protein